jgi:hypothetical protein
MKVKELVEKLLMFDQELDIVVTGYEGGVTEKVNVSEVNVMCDCYTSWYYGEHEIETDSHVVNNYPSKKVIHIARYN